MTIVVALRASNGLVMASDSQATEEAGSVRGEVQKLFKLSDRAVWGASGSGQVIREFGQELAQVSDFIDRTPKIGQTLVSRLRGVLQAHYSNFLPPPGIMRNPPVTSLLGCGYSTEGTPWIVEVDYTAGYTHYEENGFHAIGSGAGFAQLGNALLSHYRVTERPLEWGRVVAYRVVDAAIRTSAQGVGPPIQMWSVTAGDGARPIEGEELASVREAVGGWEEEERAALDRALEESRPPPAPLPPESAGTG